MSLILACHLFATFFMTGLIWFVQLVHYPLLGFAPEAFPAIEQAHMRRTNWIVAPVMGTELVTAVLLLFSQDALPQQLSAINISLLLTIWLMTMFVQVPCHQRLLLGFDHKTHRRLVLSNWGRTILWSLRSVLLLSIATI